MLVRIVRSSASFRDLGLPSTTIGARMRSSLPTWGSPITPGLLPLHPEV